MAERKKHNLCSENRFVPFRPLRTHVICSNDEHSQYTYGLGLQFTMLTVIFLFVYRVVLCIQKVNTIVCIYVIFFTLAASIMIGNRRVFV